MYKYGGPRAIILLLGPWGASAASELDAIQIHYDTIFDTYRPPQNMLWHFWRFYRRIFQVIYISIIPKYSFDKRNWLLHIKKKDEDHRGYYKNYTFVIIHKIDNIFCLNAHKTSISINGLEMSLLHKYIWPHHSNLCWDNDKINQNIVIMKMWIKTVFFL